jgi:hypothetical protein
MDLHRILMQENNGSGGDAGGAPSLPPASDPAPATPSGAGGAGSSTPAPSPSGGGAPPPEQGGAGGTTQTMQDAIASGLKELQEGARPAPRKPKAEVKPGEQPAGKQPDKRGKGAELEDVTTPPEGLTPRGQERWSKLTDTLKQKDAQLEQRAQEIQQARSEVDTMRGLLREARATPEDFGAALEYIKAVRTGDLATAEKLLIAQLREIQVASGRTIEPNALDALADFPDLREAVAKYEITEERALELARARRQEAARTAAQQAHQMNAQQVAAFVRERDGAVNTIRAMVQAWKESDLDFGLKEPKIAEKIGRLKAMPPRFWPSQIKQFYEDLNDAISLTGGLKRPAGPPQGGASARPLSGGSGPNGPARAPTTMIEAIRAGLGKG